MAYLILIKHASASDSIEKKIITTKIGELSDGSNVDFKKLHKVFQQIKLQW